MTESISRKFSRLGLGVSETGTLTVNSATATKWATARTLTLGGDLSGNVSIDGSENVTLNATVSGNTVALGTDTTGDYVATVSAGTGITTTGTGESAAVTVALSASGVAANSYGSSTAVPVLTIDTYGRITSATTASVSSGLNIAGDTGADSVSLISDTLTVAGGTGLSSTVTNNTVTLDIDNTVATLTGTQTLTNKTINGGDNTISNIGNSSLTNSSITINGTSVSLGGTRTLVTDDVAEDASPVNLWFTNTRARGAMSATDAGGDGSFTYDSGTGVFTYTGPSASEVRAHFSAGTGVTISSGQVAIGQAVGTTDNVTFNDVVVSGNLTVSGTTTTINTETINLADNTVVLNSNETGTPSQDAGIEVERGTSSNVTLLWDETNDRWTVGSQNFVAGTFVGALSGNASTASAWATGRTLTLSGDVTGTSPAFDGSGNLSFAATLANSGVTEGTYTKVTVDAKGRVTVGASLASGDLPTYTGTITSSQVTTALGYTPYNATNPNGYTTNTGTVTSVSGTGTASGLTLSGTVTTSGNLTLSGTVNSLAAGTYAIDISGNAATVTNGVYTTGDQTINGAKTFSNAGFSSAVGISKTAHAAGADAYHLELYSPDSGSSQEVSMRFHQGGRFYHQIRVRAGLFRFTQGNSDDLVDVYASTFYGTLSGTSTSTNLINSVGITGNLDTMYQARTFGWEPDTTGRPTDTYGQGIAVVSSGNTHNNTNNWITQLGFGTNMNTAYFRTKVNTDSWGAWRTLIHSGNYTSYSPSLTGDGASGTWGINITGNAATATSATDSTKLPLAGGTMTGAIVMSQAADWYMYGFGARGASSGAYGIGLTADIANRTLSYHVPNHAAYSSSGAVPKFGWYSNGADELMTLQSATGNLVVKGTITGASGTMSGNITMNTTEGEIIVSPTGWRNTERAAIKIRSKTDAPAEIDLRHTSGGIESGWHLSGRSAAETGPLNFYKFNMNSSGASDASGFVLMAALSAAGAFNTAGAITQNGSQVLHAGNYNSYSPTLTGTGASGTWGIDINGVINTTIAGGSVLIRHSVSEVDAWIFMENAANWGLYWKNNPSGQHTFGGYTSVGAELVGMSAANASGNGVATTNYVGATSAIAQWMISNYTGYIWSASTIYAVTSMVVGGNTVLHAGNYGSYAIPLSGATFTGGLTGAASTFIRFGHSNESDSNDGKIGASLFASGLNIVGTRTVVAEGRVIRLWGSVITDTSQPFLHSGNYSSYALPLSGGSISGQVTITPTLAWNNATPALSIGGAGDGRIQVRHIWGKSASSTGVDHLWLQYANTNNHVQIGDSGGGNNLYVAGNIYANGYFGGNLVLTASNYSSYALPLSGGTLTGQLNANTKRTNFGVSGNWDGAGFSQQTNVHMQGHDHFWIGAGNAYWYRGAIATEHDLLITTMYGYDSTSYYRGITFAAENTGAGNSGYRLGRWQTYGTSWAETRLQVDASLSVGYGARGTNSDYLDNDAGYWPLDRGVWRHGVNESGYGDRRGYIFSPSANGGGPWGSFVSLEVSTPYRSGTLDIPALFRMHQWGSGSAEFWKPLGTILYLRESPGGGNTWFTKFVVQRTIESNTEVRAPIFKDTDNDAYYLNLAGDGTQAGNINGNIRINPKSETWAEGISFNMPTQATWGGLRWVRSYSGSFTGNWALGYPGTESSNDMVWWSGDNSVKWRLDHSGNMTSSGNVTAYSDVRLKKNIERIENALEKVNKINGYTFERTDVQTPMRQAGVIAQEVLEVLPEVVLGSEETQYSVAYGNMVGLLIEAIKEQDVKIEKLTQEIKRLSGEQ